MIATQLLGERTEISAGSHSYFIVVEMVIDGFEEKYVRTWGFLARINRVDGHILLSKWHVKIGSTYDVVDKREKTPYVP